MTQEERNKMSDRQRIKQFLESTIRKMCDDICDETNLTRGMIEKSIEIFSEMSKIYKNMGFDKESENNV